MPTFPFGTAQRVLDKKRTVVLLRSVVVISTSYLIVFGGAATNPTSVAYILGLIVSNLALAATPKQWFHRVGFSAGLLLGDTAVVLVGLYLTVGCFSQDFLIIYFFTIFLTTATQGVTQIALGAAMVSTVYGYWLWMTSGHSLAAGEWLRLPFFFIVAVFYAYMTEEAKQERWRRQQAERESERLRFLLTVADTSRSDSGSQAWVDQIGRAIEAVLPRLACEVLSEPTAFAAVGEWFPFRANEQSFGGLRVTAADGVALSADEVQFCKVVSLVVANALYANQQAQAATDSTRVKQEFLGTLSHELRTPLHAIIGYADLLESSPALHNDEVMRESIDRLRANACHLQDLLGEMLWFAELRAGQRTVQVDRVDLRHLFVEFRSTMDRQLAGRPIRFEWEVAPEIGTVRTDGRKLKQIISGLLSNAAKFTQKGIIRLSARAGGEQLEIAVTDSGIGIDPKHFGLIFEEFRQLDASLTRRVDGLGLGLALVQELAIILGGHMKVDSQPQEGATFCVQLPFDAARQPGAAPREIIAWSLPELVPALATNPRI